MWQNFQSKIKPETQIMVFTNEEKRRFRVISNLDSNPGSTSYVLIDLQQIPHFSKLLRLHLKTKNASQHAMCKCMIQVSVNT